MTMIVEGAAKHEAKHLAKKKVKSKLREKAEGAGKKAVSKGKDTAKQTGKSLKKKASNSKLNPKFMPAPTSYSVRKQHNLLIGMWFATSFLYAWAYFNSNRQVMTNQGVVIAQTTDPNKTGYNPLITTQTFWKRFIAIQFVFFVLSIFVLFDTFARVVGLFSVLVFLGVAFTNSGAIFAGIYGISNGMPIGQRVSNDNGPITIDPNGHFHTGTQVTQDTPSTGTIST